MLSDPDSVEIMSVKIRSVLPSREEIDQSSLPNSDQLSLGYRIQGRAPVTTDHKALLKSLESDLCNPLADHDLPATSPAIGLVIQRGEDLVTILIDAQYEHLIAQTSQYASFSVIRPLSDRSRALVEQTHLRHLSPPRP